MTLNPKPANGLGFRISVLKYTHEQKRLLRDFRRQERLGGGRYQKSLPLACFVPPSRPRSPGKEERGRREIQRDFRGVRCFVGPAKADRKSVCRERV